MAAGLNVSARAVKGNGIDASVGCTIKIHKRPPCVFRGIGTGFHIQAQTEGLIDEPLSIALQREVNVKGIFQGVGCENMCIFYAHIALSGEYTDIQTECTDGDHDFPVAVPLINGPRLFIGSENRETDFTQRLPFPVAMARSIGLHHL